MDQEYRVIRPGSRLLMFVILWLISAIAFTGISLLAGMLFFDSEVLTTSLLDPFSEQKLNWLRTLQLINQVGLLILPVILFALLVAGKKGMLSFIWPGFRFRWKYVFFSLLLLLCFIPLVNVLVGWNEGISLPSFLQGLEAWMRDREDVAHQLSQAFLRSSRGSDLAWNLLILALLPAIGEELLFRGALLPLLRDWTRSVHMGVWLSAIIFSAIHMQFFGFFPRLVLGVILGYAFVRSGSLWYPVLMHLWNNGIIVVVSWLSSREVINMDEEGISSFHPGWAVVIGLLIGCALLAFFLEKKAGRSSNPGQAELSTLE